ncbi:hypothetical protein, conserved [Eimeria acervulina]|uniref:Uncharacterized protein n=1 Tax=Eimeria acervulina TaxID=5801 RepID=U6GDX1_EIMAC|nr:hypothetical protein, conserved [Eimeria acervulina]CDI77732.1 hypothetical protein, conserved [Eimeria acervulina]
MYSEPPAGSTAADPQGLMSAEASPYPPVPTSAAHLADQVESGGARLEEVLLRMNCKYQTLFFSAAATVLTGGIFGCLSSLARFDLASLVVCIFLVYV